MISSLGIFLYISGGQKAQDVSYRRFARISTYPRLLSYPTSIKSGQIARKYKTGGDRIGTRKQRRLPQLQRRITPVISRRASKTLKKYGVDEDACVPIYARKEFIVQDFHVMEAQQPLASTTESSLLLLGSKESVRAPKRGSRNSKNKG